MVIQIKLDENSVVTETSVGGCIDGGIDVREIPDEVMYNPSAWIYRDGVYSENPDYTDSSLQFKKESLIAESKLKLAEWLNDNPMLYSDGNYYSVTEEKQTLLNSNLTSYERAESAGIAYPLKWNSTGEECVEWAYDDLVGLSLAIAAYVAPKVAAQQAAELEIKACETAEQLEKVVIDYEE
ncbi:MAG: hypothetical protein IJF18_00770 [Oscillospiraceae bacterium]|nr:hypothetical protein [Oscillospiraceae bacterium]